jgi:hypothetical protein
MRAIQQVHPNNCVCIECAIGWSVPINKLTAEDIDYVLDLDVENISGYTEDEWNELICTVCVEPFDELPVVA